MDPTSPKIAPSIISPVTSPELSTVTLSDPPINPADAEPSPSPKLPSTTTPPHRSHDPSNNLKRSDPFQFGSRYLQPTDDVFEFNAWDHVTPTAEHDAHAETQYASQRAHPVSDHDRARFNADPQRWWNRFYTHNTSHFFKDRKWLRQEFPVLETVTAKGAGKKVLLEVGAGAGNTAFPIMNGNENEALVLHAVDFAKKSVELIRNSPLYAEQRCGCMRASVWDIASDALPEGVGERSVDVVLMIFVFSALNPRQWHAAVRNVFRVLKPGGEVCFRDYGRGDLAQVRFRKGRWMEENFYARGDGTRVYFFGQDELRSIWGGQEGYATTQTNAGTEMEVNGLEKTMGEDNEESNMVEEDDDDSQKKRPSFEILSLGIDRRLIVNRQSKLKMYRCWMQGRFRRPEDECQTR